jgi:MFS transporter, PPP family, 3-phenylpropionic acid transporter
VKKIWPFTFYFWQFAGIACFVPFVVLYYQDLGLSGPEIGLLTGLSPLVALVSAPLWTGLADATRRHRLVLSLTFMGTIVTVALFPFLKTFLPVLAMSALFSVFNAPVAPLSDSAAMRLLAGDRQKYGRLRVGGTLGFTLTAPLAGLLVQSYGLRAAFWVCAGMYVLALLFSQKLWPPAGATAARLPAASWVAVARGSRALLTNPRWLLFLAGAFAGGLALAVSNNYLLAYLKELGATATIMGLALSLAIVIEVPLLFFGHRLLQVFKPYRLFLVALAISAGRLLLMGAARDVTQGVLIQLLVGLTFPAMWVAGVAYADESAPAGLSATAQGLFGAMVFGIGSAVGGFAGGPLLAAFGARVMYLIFGLVVLALVGVVAVVGHLLPAGRPLAAVTPESSTASKH